MCSEWRFGVMFCLKGNCLMVTLSAKLGNPTEPMTQGLLLLLSSSRAYQEALFFAFYFNFVLNFYYIYLSVDKID